MNDLDTINIVGIPYDSGAGTKRGQAYAADKIRSILYKLPNVTMRGIDISKMKIKDKGNLKVYPLDIKQTIKSIQDYFRNYNTNEKTIIIGGDHSITYSTVSSISEKEKIGLLWFDAHPDLLDEYMNSKYSHGSPLRRIIETNNIDKENVMLIGTRFYEGEEYYYTKDNNIFELSSYEICSNPNYINKFKDKVNEIAKNVDKLYVSIDIDVIDAGLAPGTGSPVSFGITPVQLIQFLEALPQKKKIFDIVEYSPDLDINDITGRLLIVLISEIISILMNEN